MSAPYRHFGWPVSPYSAKTRAWLTWKGIPFDDEIPSAIALRRTIQKGVGRMIMPTVLTPDGRWLQDSSEIIDTLEAAHPEPSTVPPGPTQRVASLLLELHGDEWLPMVAMHFRWNVPDNTRFAIAEFARYGLPWLPGPLGRLLVRPIYTKMQGYRPALGITDATAPGIEAFTRDLIARLDTHLAAHDYLLGGRPCLGDLALYGPLWAHVYRDPGTTHLFDDAPHVRAWFARLTTPAAARGAFLPDDAVPETLDPIFATLFVEHMAWIRDLVTAIDRWCSTHPDATRVPRALGDHPFTIGGHAGTRRLITFSQWMAQRPLDAYAALDDADRAAVDRWLTRLGAPGGLDLPIRNRFVRRAFRMALERSPGQNA